MVVCRVCGVILGIIYTQKGGFLWHKNLSAKGGDVGPISGLGRFPGVGNGGPLQDFCLENPMERGAWWPTVHRITESDTTEVTYSTMILEILFLVIDNYKYSVFVFYHTSLDISLVYFTITNQEVIPSS